MVKRIIEIKNGGIVSKLSNEHEHYKKLWIIEFDGNSKIILDKVKNIDITHRTETIAFYENTKFKLLFGEIK